MPGSAQGLYVVTAPAGHSQAQFLRRLKNDPSIVHAEADFRVALPTTSNGNQYQAAANAVKNQTVMTFFQAAASSAYVTQPAANPINLSKVRNLATGAGTVAFIDTGVDFNHPLLRNSLVQGVDLVSPLGGNGSELVDVNQDTTAILDSRQDTTAILDSQNLVDVNQDTTAILDQDTTAILDKYRPPTAFGHGTMVAGLIHYVAPNAKLMPVKAFTGDGTASLSAVVNAIYWAVDHGATVINMSFDAPASSQELIKAINYANSKRVVLVAAAGNAGKDVLVYPASDKQVLGVGATNNHYVRSVFSNYGDVVDLAAPGEGLITSYPGKHYAAVSGTSFSAPLVAGGAALLMQIDNNLNQSQAAKALQEATPIGQGLGAGELDLYRAVTSAKSSKK